MEAISSKIEDELLGGVAQYLDVKDLGSFSQVNKELNSRIVNNPTYHLWENLYQTKFQRQEVVYPIFWNPTRQEEWKMRVKARMARKVREDPDDEGTLDRVAKGVNDRILATMTGRFFVVNEREFMKRYAETGYYDEEDAEDLPITWSASRNPQFESDVRTYREEYAARGGHHYTHFDDLRQYGVAGNVIDMPPLFASDDANARYNKYVCEYRVHGFFDRTNIVVWWTPSGEISIDRHMKIMTISEVSSIQNSPLKFSSGTVDPRWTMNRNHQFDAREFWTLFICYGYFGSIGVDIYDSEIQELRMQALQNDKLKSCDYCGDRAIQLARCARCRLRVFCGRECQKKDWKKHKLTCSP